MFGIARNSLKNHQRTYRRRERLAERLRIELAGQDSETTDEYDYVREAVRGLPSHLAEIVMLAHWEGFSLNEIAAITDTPASTVRSRYAVAKRKLLHALADPPPQVSRSIATAEVPT